MGVEQFFERPILREKDKPKPQPLPKDIKEGIIRREPRMPRNGKK